MSEPTEEWYFPDFEVPTPEPDYINSDYDQESWIQPAAGLELDPDQYIISPDDSANWVEDFDSLIITRK